MRLKYYVVVDTNVLVSALLKPKSNPGVILKLVEYGIIIPLINEEILNEYKKVLSRPKFKFPNDIVNNIMEIITKKCTSYCQKSY